MSNTIKDFIDKCSVDGYPKKIDVEPVIRCKDCKYWHDWSDKSWYDEKQGYYCEYSGRAYWTADDFCSRGERRDDNEDKH